MKGKGIKTGSPIKREESAMGGGFEKSGILSNIASSIAVELGGSGVGATSPNSEDGRKSSGKISGGVIQMRGVESNAKDFGSSAK